MDVFRWTSSGGRLQMDWLVTGLKTVCYKPVNHKHRRHCSYVIVINIWFPALMDWPIITNINYCCSSGWFCFSEPHVPTVRWTTRSVASFPVCDSCGSAVVLQVWTPGCVHSPSVHSLLTDLSVITGVECEWHHCYDNEPRPAVTLKETWFRRSHSPSVTSTPPTPHHHRPPTLHHYRLKSQEPHSLF